MSGSGPTKIYIKVDSAADTQVSYKLNKNKNNLFEVMFNVFLFVFIYKRKI